MLGRCPVTMSVLSRAAKEADPTHGADAPPAPVLDFAEVGGENGRRRDATSLTLGVAHPFGGRPTFSSAVNS